MEENVRLEYFTVGDLKNWLINNKPERGLNESVISCTRAYSIINNPYVKDDTVVVSAMFVNDEVAAYTAAFPELLKKPEERIIYWNTTLYVNPKYEGRGYAYCVISYIHELYEGLYFDHGAAEASVANFKYLGFPVSYIDKFMFVLKKEIRTNSLKGALAEIRENCRLFKLKKNRENIKSKIADSKYTIKYVNFVDNDLYDFIQTNSTNDVFLRSRETFNWILNYPFMVESPVANKVVRKCDFHDVAPCFKRYAVKVFDNNNLVGFYIYRVNGVDVNLDYIYCADRDAETVYLSVIEQILYFGRNRFFTCDKSLAQYLEKQGIFSKSYVYKQSFMYPKGFNYDPEKRLHGADGDMFI